ncbi:aldose epimerase family protein [Christiangramia sp. SM2212]|uniref:Aldose 1-epimerase n=1 Tax=Christiangramia sediminicola TaxID=3073267 RepID=A0ABU1EQN4_9FLAO|nr:aldose epimerase family protein [Christiangramia sp. SM2212]MDR5590692.1 aldose epimerase family protein [Christiangramia sp. SM2212]
MSEIQKSDLKVIDLVNSNKSRLQILNYGAAIFSFKLKNKNDDLIDLVVGPREPEEYLSQEYRDENKCFGATIGRFAGRIADGKFEIDEEEYELNEQEERVHLHGGKYGFQYKLWEIDKVNEGENPSVTLSYISEHLEEGYPGRLQVTAKYTLTEEDEIKISYTAKTDKATIVNLTNHSYFNLNGGGSVSDHFMRVNASKILELDDKNLPTGNLTKLKNNPKDYRENKLLGNRELDDVYVLDVMENEVQAQLFSSLSGIKMKLSSDQPVVVVYSPETLPDTWTYLSEIDRKFPAVALEAQNYPDAPNFRNFPSSLLKPGELYENNITFAFSVK